nr:hypothetical protein [Salmonella enterica]
MTLSGDNTYSGIHSIRCI